MKGIKLMDIKITGIIVTDLRRERKQKLLFLQSPRTGKWIRVARGDYRTVYKNKETINLQPYKDVFQSEVIYTYISFIDLIGIHARSPEVIDTAGDISEIIERWAK